MRCGPAKLPTSSPPHWNPRHEPIPAWSELAEGVRVSYRNSTYKHGIEGEIVGPSGCERGVEVWDVRLDDGRTHWGTRDQFALLERAP